MSVTYKCDRRATCGCSKRSAILFSKIIGGEPVDTPYSWGWMASLRRDDSHECGASLIASFYVITAAHCVKGIRLLSRLSLNFGIINLTNIGQLRNVTNIHIHPLYDEASYANDLAILRFDKLLDLNNSDISSICLPFTSDFNLEKAEYPPVGDILVAIGWGTTAPFIRLPSVILRQVSVKAIARTDSSCANTINDDVVQFCAGLPEGEKDTCQGDSGGPLMLFKDQRWQLIGITSYGELCGAPGVPGVYTRVAYYDSFIRTIINSNDVRTFHTKQMNVGKAMYSDTKSIYRKSLIGVFFICVFIMDFRIDK